MYNGVTDAHEDLYGGMIIVGHIWMTDASLSQFD